MRIRSWIWLVHQRIFVVPRSGSRSRTNSVLYAPPSPSGMCTGGVFELCRRQSKSAGCRSCYHAAARCNVRALLRLVFWEGNTNASLRARHRSRRSYCAPQAPHQASRCSLRVAHVSSSNATVGCDSEIDTFGTVVSKRLRGSRPSRSSYLLVPTSFDRVTSSLLRQQYQTYRSRCHSQRSRYCWTHGATRRLQRDA